MINGDNYELFPHGSSDVHVLLNVDRMTPALEEMRRSAESRYPRLFAKHRQLVRLSTLDPRDYRVRKAADIVRRIEADLGHVEDGKISFNEFAKDVFMLRGTEVFELEDTELTSHRPRYIFREYINGIAVETETSVYVDSDDQITAVEHSVFPSSSVPVIAYEDVDSDEAAHIALEAIKLKYGVTALDEGTEIYRKHLTYSLRGNLPAPRLYWYFEIIYRGRTHLAYVDVKSRQADVYVNERRSR